MKECEELGLIKAIEKGYEITEESLSYKAVNNEVNNPIYKAICDFCESKDITPPVWNKNVMSIIQTKYNTVDSSLNDEYNITFQLNKRCKRLPRKVSMAYFVKVLGMDEQYKDVKAGKSVNINNKYDF